MGRDEVLVGESEAFAKRASAAGVDVRFEPWDDAFHVWHLFADELPEAREAKPPPGVKVEDAQRDWHTQHGPLIRRHAEAIRILRYVQVHRMASPVEAALRKVRGTITEPYMGHAEIWFDAGLVRSGPEVERAADAALQDERRFVDFSRSALWQGKEHLFVDRR